jgi:hypothetical protein
MTERVTDQEEPYPTREEREQRHGQAMDDTKDETGYTNDSLRTSRKIWFRKGGDSGMTNRTTLETQPQRLRP